MYIHGLLHFQSEQCLCELSLFSNSWHLTEVLPLLSATYSYFLQVWQALLAVRALVLPPTEDIETWIKFASLCRKNGRISQARSTLVKLLQVSNLSLWVVDGSVLYFVA